MNVDEGRQLRVSVRNDAAGDDGRAVGELPAVELVGGHVVRQRLVLIFGVESRFPAVDSQIPGVLNRRQIAGSFPLRPRHSRAGVHRRLVVAVERVGLGSAGAASLTFTP